MRLVFLSLLAISALPAQSIGDVMGMHDLSPAGTSPVKGALAGSCLYCHAPHNGIGGATPLWNQKLSSKTYTTYTSTTNQTQSNPQPAPGTDSLLCLSCHDGSVAPGQTQAYGRIPLSGGMKPQDVLGTDLQNSHPNSLVLPMKDSPDLAVSLLTVHKTADKTGAVRLIKNNIECTSCHDPHAQSIDKSNQMFLVRDSSNGQMCLACHDPNRLVTGKINPLALWSTSAHATAANSISRPNQALVGSYHTVAQNACSSCHMVHNAPGASRLLRGANEQDCLGCHSGGSNISPAAPNIFAEYAKPGHPFPKQHNPHDAAENVLLNQNRHATCVDCHNAHASAPTTTFNTPPLVRPSQTNVAGITDTDGISPVIPAINQYENCLRCHGTSTGKTIDPTYGYLPMWTVSAGDSLNIIPQFSKLATSSHPVTHDRSSILPQPSLRPFMLNLDGLTPGRAMGVRILCTDCHNSDDNREFGGNGANGPHGSKYSHILERRYEFSRAPRPGLPIMNLFPNPDLSAAGPYSLCSKCHDLRRVLANTSFSEHARHINDGFSCSTCHTAHGMGNLSPSVSGERLVNFDANVVAGNAGAPISYNRVSNSCNLTCHGQAHGAASRILQGHGAPKVHR